MFGYFKAHKHFHGCRQSHDEAFYAMGRHGHFAGGFGFGGHEGGRFRSGRKLGSGALQLVLLALLAEKSRHGYELIKELEQRSGGFYSPSPSMIYPALTYLEELGYAQVIMEGTKKRYEITDEGRAHLEKNRSTVDTILQQMERIGSKMSEVRRVFSGDEDPEASGREGRNPEMREARHALREALQSKKGCSKKEAQRIADILKHATEEILKDAK